MNPVNFCMLFMMVLIVTIDCSPFKVEDEFDNDFASNRDSYDDSDSNRWGRGSMRGRGGGGRRFAGRNLEKSQDNDFREVSVGGEDEASEELAAKNSDYERDDNGRMKGRTDDGDDERPFMKEDDGVPDRYIKIKKAAQEDAIARSPSPGSSSSSPSSPPPREQSRQSTQASDDETATVENSDSDDGSSSSPSSDSSSAPASSPTEDDGSSSPSADGQPEGDDGSYPKERQEEYDDDNKREPRADEVSGDSSAAEPEGGVNSYNGRESEPSGSVNGDEDATTVSISDDREEKSYDVDSQTLNQPQNDQEIQVNEPEE